MHASSQLRCVDLRVSFTELRIQCLMIHFEIIDALARALILPFHRHVTDQDRLSDIYYLMNELASPPPGSCPDRSAYMDAVLARICLCEAWIGPIMAPRLL